MTGEEQQELIRSDPRQAPGGRPLLYDAIKRLRDSGGEDAAEDISSLLVNVDSDDSPTQQSFAQDADINVIVGRFGITPQVVSDRMGVYGDFTGILDFEDAVKRVEGARARFMTLPAEVRETFDNDPGQLIYAANTMSEEEFAKLMDSPKADAPKADPPAPKPAPASVPPNSGG